MITSRAKKSVRNLESLSRPPLAPRLEDRAPQSRVHRIRSMGLRGPLERGWILWIRVELESLRKRKKLRVRADMNAITRRPRVERSNGAVESCRHEAIAAINQPSGILRTVLFLIATIHSLRDEPCVT